MLQPYESNAISVQMGVKRFTHKKWKNGPEWCCGEFDGESIINDRCGVHDVEVVSYYRIDSLHGYKGW